MAQVKFVRGNKKTKEASWNSKVTTDSIAFDKDNKEIYLGSDKYSQTKLTELTNDNAALLVGDSLNVAFSKLNNIIIDNEEVTAEALNDLNNHKVNTEDLATVATTGSYNDLTDKPNIPVGPMVFKGSLGTGGTITTLPTASSDNIGYTYKVITDGTYASQSAKVGDTFVSDGNAWILIPSGDEPTITLKTLKTNNTTAQTASASETLSGSGTINLHKVSKTGSYNDLLNKPTIPTVGTLKSDNTTAQTPSASESFSTTINVHKIAKTGDYKDLLGVTTYVFSEGTEDITNHCKIVTNSPVGSFSEAKTKIQNGEDVYISWGNSKRIPLHINGRYTNANEESLVAISQDFIFEWQDNTTAKVWEVRYVTDSDLTEVQNFLQELIDGIILEESDPTVPSYVKAITQQNITDWNNKLSSETQLSKGTTTGSGNAVTDITVNGHTITLTKGTTFASTASPTFTGTPTAPTAASGTDTTQIATTAFVLQELANFDDEIFIPVSTLPTTNIKTNKIYIVPNSLASPENNLYDEYIYKNDDWELIGTSLIDLNSKLDKLDVMTSAEITTGTSTAERIVTPKVLRDNFYTEAEVDAKLPFIVNLCTSGNALQSDKTLYQIFLAIRAGKPVIGIMNNNMYTRMGSTFTVSIVPANRYGNLILDTSLVTIEFTRIAYEYDVDDDDNYFMVRTPLLYTYFMTGSVQSETNITTVRQTGVSSIELATLTNLDSKLDTLISGTNIKTINNESLLGSGNVNLYKSGTTSQRPTTNLVVGMQYFDTTLGQPIWWNGTAWVDALGNTPGSRNYVYVENN